jgi:hypothetical protein
MGMVRNGFVLMSVAVAACGQQSAPSDDESSDTGGISMTSITIGGSGPKLDMGVGTTPSGTNPTQVEGGSEGCAEVSVSVEPMIPTIILLVDQSSSMEQDFAGQTRWEALYETIMGGDGTVAMLQSQVRFGLTLYSSENGDEGGQCPMLTVVDPALDNFEAIDAVYDPADPIDETPTGESLAIVAGTLADFAEPGPKAIVLATDGEPDTCAVPNPQEGQPESIQAVQDAFAAGISTYVISVGTEVGEDHLQDVANVGVGKDIDDANPAPFYVALDAADLVTAFEAIIGDFTSCEIPIDGIVDLPQACDGTLLLDGMELTCPDDWTMLDESTIVLVGDACETWKDGGSHAVSASWPCGAVSIP